VHLTLPAPPATFNGSKVIELADWLVEVPGVYNVTVVKQPDGLVIMEAPTGCEHSAAVMEFALNYFPGFRIKAVVTTSDAWPHLVGIREYVAAGIPIYTSVLNVPMLRRLIEAKHTLAPDRLEKQPKVAVFKPVFSKTMIGTGATRMELLPARGEIGERMMLAWFPSLKTLYASDFIQRNPPGRPAPFFMPKMLIEVQTAAEREGITGIERVFGMHLPPTSWTEILAAIAGSGG
jgi:hypothetical protein